MKFRFLPLIIAATFIVFIPSLFNGFTSWDDNLIVLSNPHVINWSWQNTLNIFTSFHYGLYHPLVILSFAAEHRFFGFDPFIYHLTNLALHTANTALVFLFVLLLTKDELAALVTALLFGVHPARVESVAWVMERKDVLYSLFFLGGAVLYLRGKGSQLFGAGAMFLLSLLSKAMAVSFPFVLLLCDYFSGKKIDRGSLKMKIPFFVLAAIFAVLAILARTFSGDLTRDPPFGITNILIGSYRLIFYYLARTLDPFSGAALYPYGSFAMKSFASLPAIFIFSPFIAVFLLALFFYFARRSRAVIFGGSFFIITLLPALFMISIGPFADRFTYIPSIGIFLLAGMGTSYLFSRISGLKRIILVTAIITFIVALSFMTWQRCSMWKDSVSLWDAACREYPRSAEAYNSRAIAYGEKGQFDQAIGDFGEALRLSPGNAGIYLNLGNLYFYHGDSAKALACFDRAIAIDPKYALAYNNRGNLFAQTGKYSKAKADFDRAIELAPNDKNTLSNRSRLEQLRKL